MGEQDLRDRGLSKGAKQDQLQAFRSVQFCKISIKCSQRKMAGFPRRFEDQAIGKAQRRAVAILFECRGDAVGLLNGQISMMQKHVDGRGDFRMSQVVRRREHPGRFHENQRGHPSSFAHE